MSNLSVVTKELKAACDSWLTVVDFSSLGKSSYFFLESSYPRSKGEKAVLVSEYFNAAYNCLSFKYHMLGENMGRLDVFTEDTEGSSRLVWRLAGNQSTTWEVARAKLLNERPFKVSQSREPLAS